ncbi:MAG: radical SAM protein [Elusimicrobia bacterium]|nr:radical SAM protein [Elusimicrobiota bacterium]
MMQERGASVGDYGAPLFLAWQLTNRCGARCLHCCEESGPDRGWPGELSKAESLRLAREAADCGIPYAAFGGGEPLSVPHVWEVFETLRRGDVSLKIETNGLPIDEAAADRLKDLGVDCIQLSLDGPTAEWHERVRPGGDFAGVVASLERLARRGLEPEVVFVPTRASLPHAEAVLDLAARLGARTFVTGPMMRLGRAAQAWSSLAPSAEDWRACAARLKERARRHPGLRLSAYPWDIVEEVRVRRDSPQAMVLVVPDGKVKLLNALPFYCGDARRQSLAEAWTYVGRAWRSPEVREFTDRLLGDPALLRHANECWPIPSLAPSTLAA